LAWEKQIVHVSEDPDGRPWYVLLVGPNVWMRRGRFSTRAGAESFRPKEVPAWLGEAVEESGKRQSAAALAGVY